MARTPLVVDIKRNALDDGPGIRTVVFFKGCTLACDWCQNPETLSPEAEIQREAERCLGCGACRDACPAGRARPVGETEAGECRLCGACIESCPGGARRVAGTRYAADALVEILLRDRVFYTHSGGGVTFSGGEPARRPAYAGAVASRLQDAGVSVLLETAGLFPWDSFARHLLPHLDTVYFDLKLADPDAHRRHTGQDNGAIWKNLERLLAGGFPDLVPRLPLVPGITDTADNLEALAGRLRGLGLERLVLLPYNPLWVAKARVQGRELAYAREEWMGEGEIEAARAVLRGAGVEAE